MTGKDNLGQPSPVISDRFQDSALKRWADSGGSWQVDDGFVDMYNTEVRDIYFSPEEPGWVEWAGLWREKDGTIKTCFAQLSGNAGLDPSYRPWYSRREYLDNYQYSWEQFVGEHGMLLGPEEALSSTKLDYVTLSSSDLGETWENLGPDAPLKSTISVRTHDGGKTWESKISDELPPGGNLNLTLTNDGQLVNAGNEILRCRDGRLVGIIPAHVHKEGCLLGVMESLDNGKTWSAAEHILPEGSDPVMISGAGDEKDLVELDDGRILVVIRTDPDIKALGLPSDGTYGPCQTYLRRVGPGKYEASPPTWTPMPHGGHPALARGADGVIWYWCTDGHWYSTDDGQSWRPTPARLISYYGKMLVTGPNEMLCVTQYLIHDSPYPYSLDSCIRQYRFSYRRNGVLQQTDGSARLALASRSNDELADLHMRADVQVDGASGIALRVQPDGRSYYVFAVILPDSEAYKMWFPPEVEAQKLAAPHAGEEESRRIATGGPMCALGRVDNGHLTVLSATKLLTETMEFVMEDLSPGDWLQIQVKVSGDLIQAAAQRQKGQPATYVGARDARYASGRVGLVTDRSTGAFKNVCVWDRDLMIRELWQ